MRPDGPVYGDASMSLAADELTFEQADANFKEKVEASLSLPMAPGQSLAIAVQRHAKHASAI